MNLWMYSFDANGMCVEKTGPISEEDDAVYRPVYANKPGVVGVITTERNIDFTRARLVDNELVDAEPVEMTLTYDQQRRIMYPSLGDQLDMLWHAMKDGTLTKVEPFYTEIAAVKDMYPKPPA